MNAPTCVTRRDFLAIAETTGALALGVRLARSATLLSPQKIALEKFSPNIWLSIAASGETTIWLAKSEMGQGVYTALPMLVADELDAEWKQVRVVQTLVEPRYADFIGTGGSSSVRTSWQPLRLAGAAAREMLVTAAAENWQVPAAECRTEPGFVIHPRSGRRASYGKLVAAAARLKIPERPKLKDPSEFRLIGKRIPRLDTPAKVNGSATYGIDVRKPGMLFAVVARCPVYGGTVRSFDAARAKAVAGVRHILPLTNTGVAVVADTTWAALEARKALEIHWNDGPNANLSSATIAQILEECSTHAAVPDADEGNVSGAFESCHRRFSSTYALPFVAHTPMEPVNCTADVRSDSCEIWGPLQYPDTVQQEAARITGLPLSRIVVHTTFLGGGFGRKAEEDFATEAIIVSKAAGCPVQLLWPREDDIAFDHFRPASHHLMKAGFDASGNLVAWNHRIVSPSLRAQWEWGRKQEDIQRGLDKWATEAPVHTAYHPANFRVDFVMAPTPVPVGAWRSVYASQTSFAEECFIDEVAVAFAKDPYRFRRELMGDKYPLHRAVLDRAARESDWEQPLPPGRFRGIAVHKYGSNDTYVAQVAEISLDPNLRVRVHRVVCAVDCGVVVHPGILESQIEGSILYGLSAVLGGEITFSQGRCQQSNFHDVPLVRFSESPQIEVHILSSNRPPTGAGEPAVPPIAPAVANAVSAALGRRIRQLPLTPARLHAVKQKDSG